MSRQSLTNLPNSDISVCPFTQQLTFFKFQLCGTDTMIHTHTDMDCYLLCENSDNIIDFLEKL